MSKVLDKIISVRNPKSPISESYRGIRTSIEFSNLDKEMKVIIVTSSMQNEGKSTVMANLAVSFANLEKKVLLLEGDLRNPSVHRMFNISNINGVTDILVNNKNFADCVHCTEVKNLHVLTCGAMPPNPSEILSSKKMKEFIVSLREYYDYIFIDAPPIGIVTDAGIISTYSDGCVFVVGSKQCDVEMAKIAKKRLEDVKANIIGAVLNKFEAEGSGNNYYNYYYQDESGRKGRNKKK
ncbi:CpsD/CapB family tyrosine-protein kinase [Romboutsia ilealis]|uniref:CpsD/CapB family tyrosine-protein kinase n=1 Tax=Romboutsia ilealis TaxID=1115758 RepID=UPI00272AB6FD|nr:CpsD/CapB family tyrosine-protein kinase [Romboutsia ilealis]